MIRRNYTLDWEINIINPVIEYNVSLNNSVIVFDFIVQLCKSYYFLYHFFKSLESSSSSRVTHKLFCHYIFQGTLTPGFQVFFTPYCPHLPIFCLSLDVHNCPRFVKFDMIKGILIPFSPVIALMSCKRYDDFFLKGAHLGNRCTLDILD